MTSCPPVPELQLRTPRLELRLLGPADRESMIRYRTISADHLRPWEPLIPPDMSISDFVDMQIERAVEQAARGEGARLAAWLIEPERASTPRRLAGLFNLNNIVRGAFENADAGWSVAADCGGRGLATEGVHALLSLAFMMPPQGLGLHRVQANIDPMNIRSLRVAEKCRFRREGLARNMLRIAGQWRDQWMHAKLAHEHVVEPRADGAVADGEVES